jgi:Zn-finger nucleic acid-binding protein
MICPDCETDLIASHREGVTLNYCPTCRGVWLARGELDKLVEVAGRDQPEEPHIVTRREAEHQAEKAEKAAERNRRRLLDSFFTLP